MKIIGLFSGVLLFSVLCLLPEVRAECFASVSEDELCEKCIIKQLLNSVFAWYHESSKPRVCVICLSLRLRQITQTSVLIISNYWMRLSRIWRILQSKEVVIHRGRRPRWITPSEICWILHILRKPNSIIALLFIQNISSFLKEFRHYALCFSAHQI